MPTVIISDKVEEEGWRTKVTFSWFIRRPAFHEKDFLSFTSLLVSTGCLMLREETPPQFWFIIWVQASLPFDLILRWRRNGGFFSHTQTLSSLSSISKRYPKMVNDFWISQFELCMWMCKQRLSRREKQEVVNVKATVKCCEKKRKEESERSVSTTVGENAKSWPNRFLSLPFFSTSSACGRRLWDSGRERERRESEWMAGSDEQRAWETLKWGILRENKKKVYKCRV